LFSEILALKSDRQVIERQARAHYEKGRIADERLDYRAAKSHFVRAAQLQPEEVEYLYKAQSLAHKAGDYRLGERFAEDMLHLAKADGEEAVAYARAANALARNLNAQGRYAKAEPLFRKGLEINERVLGPDHPDTATSYNNVASNLDDQGRYAEAEPLFRKDLEISERVLGPEHPDTATSYNNVAANLYGQSKPTEAAPMF
jgi:tetratricopeptide (TPR) repeat protein